MTAKLILLITTITTGLITGLLYAYSCSVNPGLKKLPDAEYIAAMQSINSAIQNPVFFTTFMGTLLLLPVSTWLQYRQGVSPSFWLLLPATLIYIIGVFCVTAAGNVPLNNALAGFNLTGASPADIAAQRLKFEGPWNSLHTIRTIASAIAFAATVAACLWRGENP